MKKRTLASWGLVSGEGGCDSKNQARQVTEDEKTQCSSRRDSQPELPGGRSRWWWHPPAAPGT